MITVNREDYPVIDSHCHPFPLKREASFEQYWMMSLSAQPIFHSRRTVGYEMASRELAKLFCMPVSASKDEILAERNRRYKSDPNTYVQNLLREANVTGVMVDFGFPIAANLLTKEEEQEFYDEVASVDVWRINRIELVTNRLLAEELGFDEFRLRLKDDIVYMIETEHLVSLKSVIAYFTGLSIQKHDLAEVEKAYGVLLKNRKDKVAEKVIRDYVFFVGLAICVEKEIPMQVHTGMGDAPLCDLRKTNPLLLHDAFGEPVAQKATIVLDHTGYPFVGEAGFFVSHFENLYIDLSSMIPHAAHAADTKILELLEMCPWTRIMYGSDGGSIPEHMWLGAIYVRRSMEKAINTLVDGGYIGEDEATEMTRMILSENAERVYKLR